MKLPVINNTILWVVIAVLVVLQFKSCFDKTQLPEKMIRNEERLKYLEEKRLSDSVSFQQRVVWYDSALSVSQNKFNDLESKKQPIKNAIKQVSNAVDNFDKLELSRAISEYYKSR